MPRCAMSVLALFLAAACGTGTATRESLLTMLHVNAATGSDENPGTADAPLRTISRALSRLLTEEGGTVLVAPGRYDASVGESFPLYVPNNVALLGDAATRGLGPPTTEIVGSGQIPFVPEGNNATLRLGTDVTVSGFFLSKGGARGLGVIVEADDRMSLTSCTIEGPGPDTSFGESTIGVLVTSDTGCVIRDCVVRGHRTGIQIGNASGPAHLLEHNVVRDNKHGISAWVAVAPDSLDLGGGAAGGVGVNEIAGNEIDLWVIAGTQVAARNNAWDHVPPEMFQEQFGPDAQPIPDGIDIFVSGSSEETVVDTTGATVVSP